MHGVVTLRGHAPVLPASFQIGRGWFIVVVAMQRMHWTRQARIAGHSATGVDRRGHLNGVHRYVTISCFNAEREILEAGFETFCPRERRMRIVRGRKVERVTPAFGPYLFVRFDREADAWERLLDLDNVIDVLRVMDIPVRIPDEWMDKLQRTEAGGAFDFTSEKSPFSPGDDVEIMEGPWSGLIGKVKSASPHKRIKIIMNALGSVAVDPCFLRKV